MAIEAAAGRPHIPIDEVPEMIGWSCSDCPNRINVARRIKKDSLQVMDGDFEPSDLWVPESADPLIQRTIILVQLGKRIERLYADDCSGTLLDDDFERRFGVEKKICGSGSEVVLSRLGHAVMSGSSNYGAGLSLTPEEIYTDRSATLRAAKLAELKDNKRKRKLELHGR